MAKKQEFNQGHIHEALDRISIIQSNLEDFVINAPACEKYQKIKKKVEKAQELLANAYQDLGQYM